MLTISFIVPALNEAQQIVSTLRPLQQLRLKGHEVIVADGGSKDDTIVLATDLADKIVHAPRGRARQMNMGAATASGDILLFLHADTQLPENAVDSITQALQNKAWGRFDVQLSGSALMLRTVEFMMNWRSRLSGICTGDQAMFIERASFEQLNGFTDIPLMEDIDFSRRCKRTYGYPARVSSTLMTSSRRWEQYGIWRTILLMWRLRLAYFLGTPAEQLARQYR